MLTDIKRYMMQVKRVNLYDLAQHFHLDIELTRDLLACWIAKGCVRRCEADEHCLGACRRCPSQCVELYAWQGESSS